MKYEQPLREKFLPETYFLLPGKCCPARKVFLQASEGLRGEGSECKSSQGGSESSRNKAMAGKKQRMVWTIELHKRFLNAVNHLVSTS